MPSTDSGFNVYALDHQQHARTIKQKLKEIRNVRAEFILSGSATDWATYQRMIGELEGIDEALHICDVVEKEAS